MRLILLTILIFLPAFFAAGELSILRLRPSRVQRLVEERKTGSKSINRLQKRFRRALLVCQLGITLSLIALGWMGKGIGLFLWPDQELTSRLWDISLFIFIVTIATICSGLLPKALVLNRPEYSALKLAPILEVVIKTLWPLITFLELLVSLPLRLVGLNTKWDSLVPALSAGELETLIETGGVTGLHPDERNILEGVFALRDTQVREVMVPRSKMVTLPINVVFRELMKEVHLSRHARFLVIGDSLDDVKGLIDLRQLAEPISRGAMQPNTPLKPYLQPAKMVHETSTLDELLPVIREGNPLLVVVDEHGGTEGLVTAADLIGEIVGDEIQTENEVPDLQAIDSQSGLWIASGDLEIIELNKQFGLELPESDDHHTIAGFLLEKLQHIPVSGETIAHKGVTFEISTMQGPKIDRVKLILLHPHHEGNQT